MRYLLLAITISCAPIISPVLANEWDDAISRTLIFPAKIYEYKEKKWRDCLAEHNTEERFAAMSRWVLRDRQLVAETRENVAQLRTRHALGESVDPLIEANTNRSLLEYEASLEKSWMGYKNIGGTAESIDKVVEVASPCGSPPPRPTY